MRVSFILTDGKIVHQLNSEVIEPHYLGLLSWLSTSKSEVTAAGSLFRSAK
ncbi:hypothetical protein D3C78_60580 [compost metagenome]